ncbi:type II secretion system minor pseudopilin GspJ [Psychrobacter sp. DAB_AL32B]|uniref:type II secretion system minor pseudopilin GspJ n=1 Tax=Psychrobacter sp. DAB_AL32B TaxID=1028414 RepID=UPI000B7EC19B|nr:type II secretion system minor pseudopilin GspJ [Psychrobacter sp. DAB_AL32B]OXL23140.1 type II secretion system protein GspJ [Psychrobacter sp. DAB_AL32B]
MKSQHGFTLLELMVAMAIFAMLAVAGWQVFDSVNRARERAQFHADNLAVLQYAYLQLQQDMGQIIPYQAVNTQNASTSNNNTNDNSQENAPQPVPEPFMSLDGEHISFVRFADPDPRYQSSPSVKHIEYIFADERLIRRQYTSIGGGSDSISLDSILLEGVTAGRWQAYLPEMSTEFPNKDSNNTSANTQSGQGAASANAQPKIVLLPKGIAINFTYQDMPITWQWALAPQPIPNSSANKNSAPNNSNGNGNSNDSDNNSSSGNNDTNNDSSNGTSNNNTANDNVDNNNSGNKI